MGRTSRKQLIVERSRAALASIGGVGELVADESTARGGIRGLRSAGLVIEMSAHSRRGSGGGGGRGGSGRSTPKGLLSDDELREVEIRYAEGITAVQVVDIFASRGVRFSEATFRKYVQQGLLPRSKRVGRKGKHRGSLGMYPARTIRRVNAIKRLMAEGHTIEQIADEFLRFTDVIEALEDGLNEVFGRLETDAESARFDDKARVDLTREIAEARKSADDLMQRIDGLTRRVQQQGEERYRSTGAAGSAEDLL